MTLRIATSEDIDGWIALRRLLWDDTSPEQHRAEAATMLARANVDCVTFLDFDDTGIRAFAEVALRHDHVNGCETSPVAFLEGIFVLPEHRGTGVGKRLLEAVQDWAHAKGCTELGSDAHIDNTVSQAFHGAVGFDETDRVVFFRKRL